MTFNNNTSFDVSNVNNGLELKLQDKGVLLNLDISIWTGCKKLTAKDFGMAADMLPPGKLASLGQKKVFNPNLLDPFKKLRYETRNFIERYSLPFANGFIYPRDCMDLIDNYLQEQKDIFNASKAVFLADYEANLDEWLLEAENATWRHLIANSMVDVSYVARRFGFNWYACYFNPANKSGDMEDAVTNLPGLVFTDVVETAQSLLKTAKEKGAYQTNQKAIPPFERLRDKLSRMRFFNPKAATLAKGMTLVLDSLPAAGNIEGAEFQKLMNMTNSLSSMEGIANFIKKMEDAPEALLLVDESLIPEKEEEMISAEEGDVDLSEGIVSINDIFDVVADKYAALIENTPAPEASDAELLAVEVEPAPAVGIAPIQAQQQIQPVPDQGIVPVAQAAPEQQLPIVAPATVVPSAHVPVAEMTEQGLANMFNLKIDKEVRMARSFKRPTKALEEVPNA